MIYLEENCFDCEEGRQVASQVCRKIMASVILIVCCKRGSSLLLPQQAVDQILKLSSVVKSLDTMSCFNASGLDRSKMLVGSYLPYLMFFLSLFTAFTTVYCRIYFLPRIPVSLHPITLVYHAYKFSTNALWLNIVCGRNFVLSIDY